jgi:hypothetical protein
LTIDDIRVVASNFMNHFRAILEMGIAPPPLLLGASNRFSAKERTGMSAIRDWDGIDLR